MRPAVLHPGQHILQRGLRFHGPHIIVIVPGRVQHLLQLPVNTVGLRLGPMAHEADGSVTVIVLGGRLGDEALIPALDIVGAKYEKGTLFLPQLLQAASAAQSAFEEIKTAIAQKGEGSASKGRIVLATVKGDVHDIGKNIVRVILENYGFEVLDLGRDVPVETVVDTVREKDVHLVGLSALMTTTLKSMEETIAALHAAQLDCKIMVGGAVLTPEYAEKIGADWYAKDAKRSADIAKEFFGV